MLKIASGFDHALYGISETRAIEVSAQANLAPHTLMQRAGLAVAQLALAVAPHARHIWVACGPGNNGGDGLLAALHLRQWGKQVTVTWLGDVTRAPADTCHAYQHVSAAGLNPSRDPPASFDLCIDALFGIGTPLREPKERLAQWMHHINASNSAVLSVDVPSGLDANTGVGINGHVRASHTLSLLTLKPGLFTAQGRDASGTIWWDNLGVECEVPSLPSPTARLICAPTPHPRCHDAHKGSYGDVAVVGGAAGMTGAPLLAASAALHAGAGRVYVCMLDPHHLPALGLQTELMFRSINALDTTDMAVVCGCGGGRDIAAHLPVLFERAAQLVIDADALNAIAISPELQKLLWVRCARGVPTVLTPHPLEAARLLGTSTTLVQADRLGAARSLSARYRCTVVLKGSGTTIVSPGQTPAINPTGNARLATAGTGDVLAGMVAARLAGGRDVFHAACSAVYQHGQLADAWPMARALTASQLACHVTSVG